MTFRNPAGTWAHFDLTTANAFADPARWVEHDGTLSDFLVAGSITIPLSATFPAIFKLSEGGSPTGTTLTPTSLTIDNPGGVAHGFFKWVCSRPTNTIGVAFRVAIASLTAPAAQFTTWTNSNLSSQWEPAQGSSILADPFTTPVALACSERDGVFMVTCSDGKVFTSTDGNWTLRGTDADVFQPNCLASRGSMWLAIAQSTAGTTYLKLSIDNGATWTRIAWPFAQNVTPMGISPSSGQRFQLSGAHGGALFSAQSLRTK
jgi:hypothetical protein